MRKLIGLILALAMVLSIGGTGLAEQPTDPKTATIEVTAGVGQYAAVKPEPNKGLAFTFIGKEGEEQSDKVSFTVETNHSIDLTVSAEPLRKIDNYTSTEKGPYIPVRYPITRTSVDDIWAMELNTDEDRDTRTSEAAQDWSDGKVDYTISAMAKLREISDQPAGNYNAQVIITVAASNAITQ